MQKFWLLIKLCFSFFDITQIEIHKMRNKLQLASFTVLVFNQFACTIRYVCRLHMFSLFSEVNSIVGIWYALIYVKFVYILSR